MHAVVVRTLTIHQKCIAVPERRLPHWGALDDILGDHPVSVGVRTLKEVAAHREAQCSSERNRRLDRSLIARVPFVFLERVLEELHRDGFLAAQFPEFPILAVEPVVESVELKLFVELGLFRLGQTVVARLIGRGVWLAKKVEDMTEVRPVAVDEVRAVVVVREHLVVSGEHRREEVARDRR
eukprot:18169-Pelagococcus_subviridis.AAC.2